MVMAGTGEINCLRRLRYCYGMYNQPIRYGTHVATNASLGLLFLGGGRFTLGTSDASIACLLASFFPRFPQVSSDSKTFLQALRHLWVLAAEPRCLIARDVDTKEVVYLPVKIKVKDGGEVGATQMISPTLIPDLDKLLSIRVDTPRYWPFYLDIAHIPRHKESLLRNQTLYVKRRTAFLSYMEDPKGSRSLFVRSGAVIGDGATLDFPHLTTMGSGHRLSEGIVREGRQSLENSGSDLHQFVPSFSMETFYMSFADHLCVDDGIEDDEKQFQAYCHAALLDSILQDKSWTVQTHLTLYRMRRLAPALSRALAIDPKDLPTSNGNTNWNPRRTRAFHVNLVDLLFMHEFYGGSTYDRMFSGKSENNPRAPLVRPGTIKGVIAVLDGGLDKIIRPGEGDAEDEGVGEASFRQVVHAYAHAKGFTSVADIHTADVFAWYALRHRIPLSAQLALLKTFAATSRERSLTELQNVRRRERSRDEVERVMDAGIREVLRVAGTRLMGSFGEGWTAGSVEDVCRAWAEPASG